MYEIFFFAAMTLLLAIAVIDGYTYLMPDLLTLGVGVCGFLYARDHLIEAILNAALVFGTLFCIKFLLERIKKTPVLGWGDLKICPACAFFFPLENISLFFFVIGLGGLFSCCLLRQHFCPLGPAITLATGVAHYVRF